MKLTHENKTVVKPGAAAEAAAPTAAASVLISCFIFISNFQILIFDLNFDLYFITLIWHMDVSNEQVSLDLRHH